MLINCLTEKEAGVERDGAQTKSTAMMAKIDTGEGLGHQRKEAETQGEWVWYK